MKIGYTVWTWGSETWKGATKKDFEQAAKEISELGYDAVEDFNRLVATFEDAPDEFEEILEKYGLEFVNLYHYLREDFDADYALAERCCKFLNCHGTRLLNMQAPPRPGRLDPKAEMRAPTEKELDQFIQNLTKVAKMAAGYDVTTTLHPHWGTMVERENELTYVAERLDPELVKLTLDTAHTILGGMDPVKTFSQYVDRVAYVHLKDVVVPSPDPKNPMVGFREIGRGVVDFRGVVKVLKDGGYDGVLCVELDNPRICNYKSAMISRRYIREELGL